MPTYDASYRKRQDDRVRALVDAIVARRNTVRDGRVIPNSGNLPIGTGRQFSATVMFLDICGSSARGSDDPADQSTMLTALTILFSEMIRIIEDHGGKVEKNTGDGLMAYFSKGENGLSAQTTALMAALTMIASARRLADPLISALGLNRLPFRICLDHGRITVAEVGAAGGFRGIVAIGMTANIASKMLSIAKADELLIGEAVRAGLPDGWQQFVGEVRPTGFSYTGSGATYPSYIYNGRWT